MATAGWRAAGWRAGGRGAGGGPRTGGHGERRRFPLSRSRRGLSLGGRELWVCEAERQAPGFNSCPALPRQACPLGGEPRALRELEEVSLGFTGKLRNENNSEHCCWQSLSPCTCHRATAPHIQPCKYACTCRLPASGQLLSAVHRWQQQQHAPVHAMGFHVRRQPDTVPVPGEQYILTAESRPQSLSRPARG